MKVPANFSGSVFCAKTGLGKNDWYLDADGTLHCQKSVTRDLLDSCVVDIVAIKVRQFKDVIESSYQKICDDMDYKNPERLLGFIGSPDPQYDADGRAFRKHITDTAKEAYRIMAEVVAGERPEPKTAEELLALLPAFTQPRIQP
jgi:hypothetical protein